MGATSWADAYKDARERLPSSQEARWLIEEIAGEAEPTGRPTGSELRRLDELIGRRVRGEPLQYVLGRWPFRTLDLIVDRRVLIPRPETEQVVEVALAELAGMGPGPKRVVDLGTGSGAIALSIATECKQTQVWATDMDLDALALAGANLSRMDDSVVGRVSLVHGDWWSALPEDLRGSVDLAVSNPPYISSGEMGGLDATVRDWEPRAALEAGPTGLEAIEWILHQASGWVRPGGVAVLEISPGQAEQAELLARDAGFTRTRVEPDLAGRDRVLVARKP